MSQPNKTPFHLPLYGPARLEHQGTPVKLRRKALGLLYYLALEGPARREYLADLLWGHTAAAKNLRVELHLIRQTLQARGATLFAGGEDPLTLPAAIVLDRSARNGAMMEGLETLSPEFQDWLEVQRSRPSLTPRTLPSEGRAALLASQIGSPSVVVLEGRFSGSRLAFAQELARALGLPLSSAEKGSGRAVRFVAMPHPAHLLEVILNDRESIWVIERAELGETPRFILTLSEIYPAEQLHPIRLAPLSWTQAQAGPLRTLPRHDAARLYLATGGHTEHLHELLRVYPDVVRDHPGDNANSPIDSSDNQEELPVPARMLSWIQHEGRYLSLDARLAVDRLSVHPGTLPEDLIAAFGAEAHLDELERRGWLHFDGVWGLRDEPMRRMIYANLQRGRRLRYHSLAAEHFVHTHKTFAEAYHRHAAGGHLDHATLTNRLSGVPLVLLQAHLGLPLPPLPTSQTVTVGRELELLESERSGHDFHHDLHHGVREEAGRYTLLRTPLSRSVSRITFTLPDEPCLLRLRGRGYLRNAFGGGLTGSGAPLELHVYNGVTHKAHLAPIATPTLTPTGELVLPTHSTFNGILNSALNGTFEHWFVLHGRSLNLSCHADEALLELELSLHRPALRKGGGLVVGAYALGHPTPALAR